MKAVIILKYFLSQAVAALPSDFRNLFKVGVEDALEDLAFLLGNKIPLCSFIVLGQTVSAADCTGKRRHYNKVCDQQEEGVRRRQMD